MPVPATIGGKEVKQHDVKCPDCGHVMVLRQTQKFKWNNGHGRLFYGCSQWPKCNAIHGAHPDGKPLGFPGDRATKEARMAAHAAFDSLREKRGWVGGGRQTHGAYMWLGRKLGMEDGEIRDKCHIAMFGIEECNRVVQICKEAETRA